MKVAVFENNYPPIDNSIGQGWYFSADSSVSNTGKPFYLPENVGCVTISLSSAIRISRLGKSIASKFASRYYQEIAPAIHFRLPELANQLRKCGLSQDAANSFDKSVIVGEFIPIEGIEKLGLRVNGNLEASFEFEKLNTNVNDLISRLSIMNTLKIGDLILPGLSGSLIIKEGDMIEVMINDNKAFEVKVK